MPLIKNKISVPFAQGLETKTDDNQEQLNGLSLLENVIFDTPERLRKRRGYKILNTNLLDNTQIQNARFLARFDDELGLFSSTNFYSYSESIDKWTDKGQVFTAIPESEIILRNNNAQKNIDSLVVEGLAFYTYEDSTGVRVSVTDTINDNYLTSNQLVSATGTHARLANIQNTIFIFYISEDKVNYKKINILQPNTLSSETEFGIEVDTVNNNMDCVTISNEIFVAYNSTTGLRVSNLNEREEIASFNTLSTENATNSVATSTDADSRFVITYATETDVKVVVFSFTLNRQLLSPTIIETTNNAANVVAIETNSDINEYTVFYEITDTNVKNHSIRKNTIAMDTTIGIPSTIIKSVGIASKPFINNGITHITTIHDSALQSTYFVINSDGELISKISPLLGGTILSENVVSKVTNTSENEFLFGSQIKGRTVIDNDQFFSLTGVNSTTINFNPSNPFQNERLGENLHIAGGFLKMYDGDRIVEHGFHVFPEDLEIPSTTTGNIPNGDFQYVAIYIWTDNNGQLHRSAPSIGLPITNDLGAIGANVSVPTLRLTQKEDVAIELYRTEANGTIFYKVTETQNPIINDKNVDSIIITDTLSDTDLIDNEVLYTTGGVLDNIAAPSSTIVESFADRIFIAGLEDENQLQFSKLRFDNEPVEFNDSLTIAVNDEGGDITALKTMDDKLIIFEETAVLYLSGDGPNNLGQQDTHIKPELISSDIGCVNVNSVVLTPEGIMFKSSKGIYLLSRNLALTYIGAPVEAFNNLNLTSAIVIPEENQVRFTSSNGEALVYNYYTRQWATFTNYRALSAVNIIFTYYYLRFDGIMYIEDESSFTDNGSPINMSLTTGWVSFAGVQGFQRVYKLLLLGNYFSPHKLRVRVAYDFNEAFVQEVVVDTNDFTDNNRYGDYSNYGDPSTLAYGGDGNVHQMRINLKRQKCQAIKIEIEEIQDDTNNLGEGLSLSNIMFEIGEKVGTNAIDTGRDYGTK